MAEPLADMIDWETEFILSQIDIDDKEDFQLTEVQKEFRFHPPVDQETVEHYQKSRIPDNTAKMNRWGVTTWNEWMAQRNVFSENEASRTGKPAEYVPPLTEGIQAQELNYWLSKFVIEARRQNGNRYPPDSLKQLCCSIARHLRDSCNRPDLNFMDKTNGTFLGLRNTLDGVMKELSREGIGTVKKQAQPYTIEHEEKLWQHSFDTSTALGLSYAVYFYMCKIFGLRAADEHSGLTVDQLSFQDDHIGEYVVFHGKPTKTDQGGLYRKPGQQFKTIKHYAQPENPRCVVKLFQTYLSYIPKKGPFYRRPLAKATDGKVKFSQQKIGVHTLRKYCQEMTTKAGIDGYFTGHSGKVTQATSLYRQEFDEQLILNELDTEVQRLKVTNAPMKNK
ncbi:zinc finger MYM-type protein 2-like [Ptychodera flava]|uniref:zinc finger MYM-type protein 2-like n=1 Tax=Ptychodera flava TaxID=63121 RepID=UPI00396A54C3